ncbi:MAG: hypothetical protein NTV01_03470 [Bacteroidia bacterium]|nr:hypothetical protein [Bacteroidia bacterium]
MNNLSRSTIVLLTSLMVLSCNQSSNLKNSIAVNLRPMVPNDSVSIRWSPKGEKLVLTGSGNDLSTGFYLGSRDLGPFKLVLS